MIKTCIKCLLEMEYTFFYRNKRTKTGYTSVCKKCFSERQIKRYHSDPQYFIEKTKQWGQKYPERKKLQRKLQHSKNKKTNNENSRIYKLKNPDKVYFRKILKRYKITKEQYLSLFEKQRGLCAICKGLDNYTKRLAVDHCHKTGKIRGLLCGSCNRGIGLLKDSFEILLKAHDYLLRQVEEKLDLVG